MGNGLKWFKENCWHIADLVAGIGWLALIAAIERLSDAFLDHPVATSAIGIVCAVFGFILGYTVGRRAFRDRKARLDAQAVKKAMDAEGQLLARRLLRQSKVTARYLVAIMLDDGELVLPDYYDINCLLSSLLEYKMVEYENVTAEFGYGEQDARRWTLTGQGRRACEENPDAIMRPPADIAENIRCGYCYGCAIG